MSYRGEVELDAEVFAEIVEFARSEVVSVVSKDAVRHAESTGDAFEEFHGRGGRLVRDRYDFYPLGELVDCYQEMRVSTR